MARKRPLLGTLIPVAEALLSIFARSWSVGFPRRVREVQAAETSSRTMSMSWCAPENGHTLGGDVARALRARASYRQATFRAIVRAAAAERSAMTL
jgi:hypothetical protein